MFTKTMIALSTALVLAAASAAPAMAKHAKHHPAARGAAAAFVGAYASAPRSAGQMLFERAKGNTGCERTGTWCSGN